MSNSRRWSSASAPCRLEWRPSRLFACLLVALGAMGAVSALASALPAPAAAMLAAASLLEGLRLAMRERRSTPRMLLWPMGAEPTLDGVRMRAASLQWRGTLAILAWRDDAGRRHRLAWWPDALDAMGRRELRLAAAAMSAAAGDRSMAP